MCGISGLIFKKSQPFRRDHLLSRIVYMNRILNHRGPDDKGQWIDEKLGIAFGHTRLSIIDPKNGQQPMIIDSARPSAITYNGQVYNYREIKGDLQRLKKGPTFRTQSDTEVVLEALRCWGTTAFSKFRGMFALGFWEGESQALYLARDPYGIKPLYYCETDEAFYFASEIKALLPFLNNINIEKKSLSEYLHFQFCLENKTLFKGVSQVPPGALMKWDREKEALEVVGNTKFSSDLTTENIPATFNDLELVEETHQLLQTSVGLHLRSDVPVAVHLSGGLDSTAISWLSSERQTIQAFVGRYPGYGPGFDEFAAAQETAQTLGIDLIETNITAQDFVEYFPKVIFHLDQPASGAGAIGQFLVAKTVSQHARVVLTGQGGDELFGGYVRYLILMLEVALHHALKGESVTPLQEIMISLPSLHRYQETLARFWKDNLFQEPSLRFLALIDRSSEIEKFLMPTVLQKNEIVQSFQNLFQKLTTSSSFPLAENAGWLEKLCAFDFQTLLPSLLQVEDRMSMAHGVEARVPFLDPPLVNRMMGLSSKQRLMGGQLKGLLRQVLKKRFSDSTVLRTDKIGFVPPLMHWLKTSSHARDFVLDSLSSQKARQRFYLNSTFDIESLARETSEYGRALWILLSLEVWQRHFIDQPQLAQQARKEFL